MNSVVRPATRADIAAIMPVIAAAKGIMRASGNAKQWAGDYPSALLIAADIDGGNGYVLERDSRIVGYFAAIASPEPTYDKIYDGEWLDDVLPYHVVHRIASLPEERGILADILDYCFSLNRNIRIDTHRDNSIMRHLLAKHGFAYCGIIYLANGDERLAFQKLV